MSDGCTGASLVAVSRASRVQVAEIVASGFGDVERLVGFAKSVLTGWRFDRAGDAAFDVLCLTSLMF